MTAPEALVVRVESLEADMREIHALLETLAPGAPDPNDLRAFALRARQREKKEQTL